ncbi:hypothetical protein SGCZBJ_17500 [Caulobacter zeae]|uniref:Uncharacterized protein n=1 Tax=Caulobacter zeae TaxID=2055137 RepID=A0A2N5D9V4_9CAUL|nr:hypothetical protein SGCZBJ_17500 [Caulobacter zeae]
MIACSLSQRERVGVRGYGVRRSPGTSSNLVTSHPPTAARRAPPSLKERGVVLRTAKRPRIAPGPSRFSLS